MERSASPFLPSRATRSSRGVGVLALAAMLVVSFNMRPAIVTVGPLTDQIRAGTSLDTVTISLLTTLPVVCLGVFAAIGPRLVQLVGLERGIMIATFLITTGCLLRLGVPVGFLFAGSLVAGAGIAVANVLVPTLIKRDHPVKAGLVLTLFSVALQLGATAASGFTLLVQQALNLEWRTAMAAWMVPAVLAIALWAPRAIGARPAPREGPPRRYPLWRSSLGWSGAGFIGLQSAVFFSLTAWLPDLLIDAGIDAQEAGLALAVVAAAGILGGLPVPVLALRMRDPRRLVLVVAFGFLTGLAGLLVAPAALLWVAAVLLGLAQGAGLILALSLFTSRARTFEAAGQLSGMAQSAGYLIASTGPIAAGVLRTISDGWVIPLIFLVVLLVPMLVCGLSLARPRAVEDEIDPAPTTVV